MNKYYTGVGSRNTPKDILELMTKLAVKLEQDGFTLRSGGADGADDAFAHAVDKKDIFLPWPGFNGLNNQYNSVCDEAYKIAESLHPAWDKCSQGARKLHGRNVYQVLGKDLNTPSSFLVCWTPNAAKIGGTATAIRLAEQHKIKVLNLANLKHFNQIKYYLNKT